MDSSLEIRLTRFRVSPEICTEAPDGVREGPSPSAQPQRESWTEKRCHTLLDLLLIPLARSRDIGQMHKPWSRLFELLMQPSQSRGRRLPNNPSEQVLQFRKEGMIPLGELKGRHLAGSSPDSHRW